MVGATEFKELRAYLDLSLSTVFSDRYYAISRPLHYIPLRTNRLILISIVGIQLLAALVSAPALVSPSSGLVPNFPPPSVAASELSFAGGVGANSTFIDEVGTVFA